MEGISLIKHVQIFPPVKCYCEQGRIRVVCRRLAHLSALGKLVQLLIPGREVVRYSGCK